MRCCIVHLADPKIKILGRTVDKIRPWETIQVCGRFADAIMHPENAELLKASQAVIAFATLKKLRVQ